LFDFATGGTVLGPIKAFKERYSKPIERARDKKASDWEVGKGQQMNEQLQNLLRPYFLQRLKVDYLLDQLPPKLEMVVWTDLSVDQRQQYSAFIRGEKSIVKAILSGATSTLEAITWLKKLCGHPLLVEQRFTGDAAKTNEFTVKSALRSMDPRIVMKQSEKLKVAVEIIKDFQRKGHRALVFSQSTRMLDILQFVLSSTGIRVFRIDGSTKEKDRQWLVDEFNGKRCSCDVMLLSTKAAGVGLTLTGADRVILYDPSWNPSEDSQAVDRACTSMC
jgi:DNA excision repair protein ERCC-6